MTILSDHLYAGLNLCQQQIIGSSEFCAYPLLPHFTESTERKFSVQLGISAERSHLGSTIAAIPGGSTTLLCP